jgi:hypothetical protein
MEVIHLLQLARMVNILAFHNIHKMHLISNKMFEELLFVHLCSMSPEQKDIELIGFLTTDWMVLHLCLVCMKLWHLPQHTFLEEQQHDE